MSENNENISSFEESRRQFFSRIFPAGLVLGLGCCNLLPCSGLAEELSTTKSQHKFLESSEMSFQQVFNFAYTENYIPMLQAIASEMGKDKFIEILKRASSEIGKKGGQNMAQSFGKNDMASWAAFWKEDELGKHAATFEFIEETDIAFEFKVTECLWAKTFRDTDASDIGYASICYGEYASATAFNPKMKMILTKTLMQGDDCCNPRWVIGA